MMQLAPSQSHGSSLAKLAAAQGLSLQAFLAYHDAQAQVVAELELELLLEAEEE